MNDSSLNRTASWMIRRKEDGVVIAETFNPEVVKHLNDAHEAIPILEYLGSLNVRTTTETPPD